MSGSVLLLVISIVLPVLCIGAAAASAFLYYKGSAGFRGRGRQLPEMRSEAARGYKVLRGMRHALRGGHGVLPELR